MILTLTLTYLLPLVPIFSYCLDCTKLWSHFWVYTERIFVWFLRRITEHQVWLLCTLSLQAWEVSVLPTVPVYLKTAHCGSGLLMMCATPAVYTSGTHSLEGGGRALLPLPSHLILQVSTFPLNVLLWYSRSHCVTLCITGSRRKSSKLSWSPDVRVWPDTWGFAFWLYYLLVVWPWAST